VKRRGVTLVEVLVVITIIAILASLLFGARGGCLIGCNSDYSEGERVGVVTKLSLKGWQYKTWEGEMNLGGLASNSQGQLEANVWNFTVPDGDEATLKLLQEAQRSQKPVIIRYKQWMVRPSCQTDSGYIVQSAEYVKAEPSKSK
jgi:prepilin-type N-terminal cleavage/methylation domain-containing protein